MRIKRLFDILVSVLVLLLSAPIFFLIALGIVVSSKGSIFYRAERAGLNGKPFVLYKFRTMTVGADKQSAITGVNDSRVFTLGQFLRKSKLDELPQFWNVLKGEMSVVGPRPESIDIVNGYYNNKLYRSTLNVLPGIASPGSLFNYTSCQDYIDDNDPELSYINKFLPIKLGIEVVYVDNQTFLYDIKIIYRTVLTIIQIASGKRKFSLPPEFEKAQKANFFYQESTKQ